MMQNGLVQVAALRNSIVSAGQLAVANDISRHEQFTYQLSRVMSGSQRYNRLMALLIIELDNFQEIANARSVDEYCNYYIELLNQLQGHVRITDSIIPLAANKVAIILEQINDYFGASTVVRRISKQCQNHIIPTKVSIGINCYPLGNHSLKIFIAEAEMALHTAKRQRHNYYFFTDELNVQDRHRQKIIDDMHVGLMEKQFYLSYQPIFDLRTEKIVALDTLIRWDHPSLDIIGASYFIPLAEKSGLLAPITQWVLEQQQRDLGSITSLSTNTIKIHIKHSPILLHDNEHRYALGAYLRNLPTESRNKLVLALDESKIPSPAYFYNTTLDVIHEFGIKACIENFGSTHCALNSLQHPALVALKLEPSLISKVDTQSQQQNLCQGIAALAEHLGLQTIATNVEKATQLNFLRQSNFQFAQGYLLCKPLSASVLAQALAVDNPRIWTLQKWSNSSSG